MTENSRQESDNFEDILNVHVKTEEQQNPIRELLFEGGEVTHKPDKKRIAISKCEITFEDEESLQKCVQVLRESDEHLRNRPDERKLWEWEVGVRLGMTIYFGVSWYDKEFFNQRKNAFLSPAHLKKFASFNKTADDIKVQHYVLDESNDVQV